MTLQFLEHELRLPRRELKLLTHTRRHPFEIMVIWHLVQTTHEIFENWNTPC